jgi:hypothetical protein
LADWIGCHVNALDFFGGVPRQIRTSRSGRIPGGETGGLVVAPERSEPQQPQEPRKLLVTLNAMFAARQKYAAQSPT